MNIRYYCLLFAFIITSATHNSMGGGRAYAQESRFNDYVQKLAEHPQVTEILEQSAKYKSLSKSAMGLPDPSITIGVDNIPVDNPAFDRFLPSAKVLGFRQQIPSYSLRKAKSKQNEQISAKNRIIADYTIQRLEAILISMLANLHKVKHQEEYAAKQLRHYRALEDYFKGRMEAGNSVYWRFSEIDVERSLVETKLNNLRAERSYIESELIRLVGEVPDIAVPTVENRSWDGSVDNLYPLIIAKEDIAIANAGIDIASAEIRPNYGIDATYKQRESNQNFSGDDWFAIKASISIPLWYSWNQKPKLQAAKAGKRSAKNSYDNAVQIWTAKIRTLTSERDAARRNIDILIEKNKALDEMVAAARRNYEAGEANLDAVLDAQINQLTIKSQLEEQRAKFLTIASELNSYLVDRR